MRKAFTLIELMIVIAIIAIVASIAIPNLIEANKKSIPRLYVGDTAKVINSNIRVTIVSVESLYIPRVYTCRIDNGPQAIPRYSEIRFTENDLEPVSNQ